MSELMNEAGQYKNARFQLLVTVSAVTLITAVCANEETRAADEPSRPTIWIELGGQLEAIANGQDAFTAPFAAGAQPPEPFPFAHRYPFGPAVRIAQPDVDFDPARPFGIQKPPPNSFGGEAKISIEPRGTDWVFTAAVHYGRSNGHKSDLQKTDDRVPYNVHPGVISHPTILTPDTIRFSNARANFNESHVVLDFQAGKDVGLGLFGSAIHSQFDAGVRYAQFTSKSSLDVVAVPYLQIYGHHSSSAFSGPKYHVKTRFHSYDFSAHSTRSFHGIGPSLSWSGTSALAGDADTAQFALDWGVNGALLFGRQKVATDHRTTSFDRYYTGVLISRVTQYKHTPPRGIRSHSVVVPNLGGFAGLSLKFPNAKVSLGYRADFFFGAMDAGIDARHTEDMSFHGPFATIGIGLGG